jgi:AcrR family transcriptional regulator
MSVTPQSTRPETRARIVAASREYFFKNGHRGVTMEALAEVVGVSKKTLYVYFPTKLAILEAAMDMQFTILFESLESVRAANEENPIVCFEAVFAKWQEILVEIQPVFWRDVHLDARHFLESTESRRLKIVHGIFGRIIRDGIAKGDFKSDLSPELGTEVMLAAIEGIIRSERLAKTAIPMKELILGFVRRTTEGCLTGEGHKKLQAVQAAKLLAADNHEQN